MEPRPPASAPTNGETLADAAAQRWPPLSGRKHYSSDDLRAVTADLGAVRRNRSGKKLYAERQGTDIEAQLTFAERMARRDRISFDLQRREGDDDHLRFLRRNERRWVPSGGKSLALFESYNVPKDDDGSPKSKKSNDESPPRKVSEVSARLLKEKKTKEPPPIKTLHDKKKEEDERKRKSGEEVPKPKAPFSERLVQDAELRERKHQDAIKAALAPRKPKEDPLAPKRQHAPERIEDMDDFVNRHYVQASQAHRSKIEGLLHRAVAKADDAAATPRQTLTAKEKRQHHQAKKRLANAEEQAAITERLYKRGMERESNKLASLAHKYIDEVQPPKATITASEVEESAKRLSTPRGKG